MEKTITIKDMLAWTICTLFFMYEFSLRTVFGTLQPSIMSDFQISTIEFSMLSTTSYQCIYAVMQILTGVCIERFGLKYSLLTAVTLCCLSSFGFCLTHQFNIAIFLRIVMGLGSSFGFVCLLVTIYDRLPRRHSAVFIGISQFLGTLGPLLAAGPLCTFSDSGQWREIFFIFGLLAAVLAIMVIIGISKYRSISQQVIILARPSTITEKLVQILKQPQIWFIAFFSGSIYFSIEYLSENEGVNFLVTKGLSPLLSSYMISVAWLGYALGCPILGFLSDKTQRRKPFIIFSAIITMIALVVIIYLPAQKTITIMSFFLLGFGVSGSSLGYALAAEQSKEDNLALILGFNNMIIVAFTLVSTLLQSTLLTYATQSHQALELVHYQKAFIFLIAFLIPAVVLSFKITETFCKSQSMNTKLVPNKPEREESIMINNMT